MDTPSMTIDQIEEQIGAARERLAVLDNEAQDLAMPAVSGNEDAAASLGRINSELRQITGDLAIFDRARLTAIEQQRKASEAEAAAYRARALELAQDRAAAIVRLATRADDLVVDLKTVYADLAETEKQIWSALHSASAPPPGAIVGRKGLADFAVEALTAFTMGSDRFRQPRSVADVAGVAWAFLLTNEADHD